LFGLLAVLVRSGLSKDVGAAGMAFQAEADARLCTMAYILARQPRSSGRLCAGVGRIPGMYLG